MSNLKVNDLSLCLLHVYAPNAVSEDLAFVDDVYDALQRVRVNRIYNPIKGILTHTLEQTMKHEKE